MQTKTSGQRWARFGLGFGAALSVLGNVAHTVLADSDISLWLRIPFAVVWPVALFIGIEVLVRVDWRRKFIDHAGRTLIWGPTGTVAAVVSYLHLHDLMQLAGEDGFSAAIGPLAIDGLMIGCTVALLAIRAASLAADELPSVPERLDLDEVLTRWQIEESAATDIAPVSPPALTLVPPVSPAPAGAERRTRAGKPEQEKAVRMMLEGRASEAVEGELMGASTMRRYEKVMRTLRDNPQANIPASEKARPELVAIIRDEMNRERVR